MKMRNIVIVVLVVLAGGVAVLMLQPYFFDREPVDYDLRLSSIEAGQAITSPVEVTGYAHRNWFYKNTFPVQVRNDRDDIIGQGVATAVKADTSTEDGFLPFSATIEFEAVPGTQGTLVLMRSNPENKHNNYTTIVPVRF